MVIKFSFNKNIMTIVLTMLLASTVTGVLVLANQGYGGVLSWVPGNKILSEAVAKKTLDYINTSLLTDGKKAVLNTVTEENGLIKINMTIDGNAFNSYVTRNGKFLFPSDPLTIGGAPTTAPNTQPTATQTPKNLTKVDNTMLEAYVVSRCPYGLQMQRVMADAISNIPSLADHIKVRYMGSVANGVITSMHGDAEAQENLRQICIREEQSSKYWNYVACQMKNGDTTGCQASTGIDSSKLSACIKDPKQGLAYAQADFELSNKFGVTGSPTLILNNTKVSEFDFGGRSSDAIRKIVCDSSSTEPGSCSKALNTTSAATSFSTTYAGATTAAPSSNATGSNCAPATPT